VATTAKSSDSAQLTVATLLKLRSRLPHRSRNSISAWLQLVCENLHGASCWRSRESQQRFNQVIKCSAMQHLMHSRGAAWDARRQEAVMKIDFEAGHFEVPGFGPMTRVAHTAAVDGRRAGGAGCSGEATLDEMPERKRKKPSTGSADLAFVPCNSVPRVRQGRTLPGRSSATLAAAKRARMETVSSHTTFDS
jgi:hypothetical protein